MRGIANRQTRFVNLIELKKRTFTEEGKLREQSREDAGTRKDTGTRGNRFRSLN
jgi:hypothetical protein